MIQLKKPARVPIAPWIGLYPALWDGMTAREAYYDFDRLAQAWDRWHGAFRQDAMAMSISFVPGELFDILDYRLYDWPGHGVPDTSSYQYLEKEWMKADEYDQLIADPAGYWQRVYLTRVFGALEPAAMLSSFTNIVEMPMTAPSFIPFGIPPVQEMLQKVMDAGRVALDWVQKTGAMDGGRDGEVRHGQLRRQRHEGALRHPRRHAARHARPHARQVPPAATRCWRRVSAWCRSP